MSRADAGAASGAASPVLPPQHGPGYTAIGVDLGEWYLAAAAPAGGHPDTALAISGEHIRSRHSALVEATRALNDASFESARGQAQVFAAVVEDLRAEIDAAAARVVEYAQEYPAPLIVIEDLSFPVVPLWEHRTTDQLGSWLLPTLQEAITTRARDAGLPVATVDPSNSTQECHACGEIGTVGDNVLECTTDDCPVDTVCRDRSAALTIAQRGQPETDG